MVVNKRLPQIVFPQSQFQRVKTDGKVVKQNVVIRAKTQNVILDVQPFMAPTEWLKVMALSVEITRLEFKPHTAYLTAVSIKPLNLVADLRVPNEPPVGTRYLQGQTLSHIIGGAVIAFCDTRSKFLDKLYVLD